MAKKDFSNSPAMSFFSSDTETAGSDQHSPRVMGQGAPADGAQDQTASTDDIRAWKTADSNGKNRKTIIEVPDGYTLEDVLIEKRTKRVNVLLQPSLYERMKARAELMGVSFNEIVNRAFAEYLER